MFPLKSSEKFSIEKDICLANSQNLKIFLLTRGFVVKSWVFNALKELQSCILWPFVSSHYFVQKVLHLRLCIYISLHFLSICFFEFDVIFKHYITFMWNYCLQSISSLQSCSWFIEAIYENIVSLIFYYDFSLVKKHAF